MPRISIVERDKHRKMLDEMHSALSTLGSHLEGSGVKLEGDHLLPGDVLPEDPKSRAAREHIERLHMAFKSAKMPGARQPSVPMTTRKQPDNLPVQTGGPGTSGLQEMNK
jgi:hypothetical protein